MHKLLGVTKIQQGRIERRQGSWTYYQAHRNDGKVCNFARKSDAIRWLGGP